MKRLGTLILACFVAAPTSAHAMDSLLFTTSGVGFDRTVSGSSGTILQELSRQDVGVITPGPGASAIKGGLVTVGGPSLFQF